MTDRNFNQDMAKASRCVIAEVEEIVEAGQLDPESIHVPGVFVHRIYKADPNSPWSETKLQKLTVEGEADIKHYVGENDIKYGKICFNNPDLSKKNKNNDPARLKIAKRTAQEVKDGMHINLGIGIPTRILAVLPKDI